VAVVCLTVLMVIRCNKFLIKGYTVLADNPKAPAILNEIVAALKTSNLTAITENNEGRVNSKKDEDQIIAWLLKQSQFKDKIKEGELRGFGDMWVMDSSGKWHVVNIKTSVGSSDNAFSKLGILWALTDLTIEDFRTLKIANKISDTKFADLVVKHKKEIDRDYWYLSLDKKDFSKVMVRGVKQIKNWGKNPTNNLQIQWDREHESEPNTASFEDTFYNIIIDGAFKCWADKAAQWAGALDYRLKNIKVETSK